MTQQQKLSDIKNLIEAAELSLQQARKQIGEMTGDTDMSLTNKASAQGSFHTDSEGQVVEGVFNGQHMIGPDGKEYSVPANYASKSKLVEGDLMKLTIQPNGHFVYKQIGPIERARLKGALTQDEQTGEWRVIAEGKAYKVILASVTYFKGEAGDEAVIMVPKDKSSQWAAVETIMRPTGQASDEPSSGFTPGGFTPGTAPAIASEPVAHNTPYENTTPVQPAIGSDNASPTESSPSFGSFTPPESATPETPPTPSYEPATPATPGADVSDPASRSTYGNIDFDDNKDEFGSI